MMPPPSVRIYITLVLFGMRCPINLGGKLTGERNAEVVQEDGKEQPDWSMAAQLWHGVGVRNIQIRNAAKAARNLR